MAAGNDTTLLRLKMNDAWSYVDGTAVFVTQYSQFDKVTWHKTS